MTYDTHVIRRNPIPLQTNMHLPPVSVKALISFKLSAEKHFSIKKSVASLLHYLSLDPKYA